MTGFIVSANRNIAIRALCLTAIAMFATGEGKAQNLSVPYYPSQYSNAGFGGKASNNSFNGGFAGLAGQTQTVPQGRNQPRRTANTNSTMSSLEDTMNAIDTSSGWARTPMSGEQSGTSAPRRQASGRAPQTGSPGPVRSGGRWQPGTTANNMSGMFPGVSRQEMMRCFFEGGTPQMGSSGYAPPTNNSGSVSTAYSNYQIAQNESTKAKNDANTARYNSSQWNRKDAASRAEYAANNANYAAQRAESAAYSGDSQARNYANLARQAANRARASANQARYNADTIR